MNNLHGIGDKEFIPFLNGLGVETYNKSFEWMLNDPEFAGILSWLYSSLDKRNALNAREEYRYAELQKNGLLLSSDDLESSVNSILWDYEHLPLPGEQDELEDLKLETIQQKERLGFLEKSEVAVKDLISQNDEAKDNLIIEITNLNALKTQYDEDEQNLSKECLVLAKDVESVMDTVMDVVADTLNRYSNCYVDTETSRNFLAFGPFESYKQSQALFKSHFDFYVSKKLDKKQNDNIINEYEHRNALINAKDIEERLAQAIVSYINTKADLNGEQATLSLVANYESLHGSQIPTQFMEAKNAVELLEQEELILDQEIEALTKEFVSRRTCLAVETAVRAALAVREDILRNLEQLRDITERAYSLDATLYYVLRHELRTVQDLIQFADDLKCCVDEEKSAVRSRIESMETICQEQKICEDKLQAQDPLLRVLSSAFGLQDTVDVMSLVKMYADLKKHINELEEKIHDQFVDKERQLVDFKKSQKHIEEYLWNGSTIKPNRHNRVVSSLQHTLKQDMEITEKNVIEVSEKFISVKNGDKQNLRKLWQWFLTDKNRLLSLIKETQMKSFS